MMIVVTPEDFRKLSKACQQELISMLGFSGGEPTYPDEALATYAEEDETIADRYIQQPRYPTANDVVGDKQVIDIDTGEAKLLVANVSDKSLATLKLFAKGEPIGLNDLVGNNKPYESFNDLKRSFVGAVNRRLRTVTGNRQAVLFLSVKSNGNDGQTQINVKPRTAAALRRALNVQEPLPEFEYYGSEDGQLFSVTGSNGERAKLMQLLADSWKDYAGYPTGSWPNVTNSQVAEHYLKHGFSVRLGVVAGWDDDEQMPKYEFGEPISNMEDLMVKLTKLGDGVSTQLGFVHQNISGLLALPAR